MWNVHARFIQVDEMHGYVQVRQNLDPNRHDETTMGEQYVFMAIDSETKLIPTFLVGKRSAENAYWLMKDLEGRLASRVQATTDGFRPYVNAVDETFGTDVDYAMLVKVYGGDETNRERYSPSEIVEAVPIPVTGNPKAHRISTSHVERQNLTLEAGSWISTAGCWIMTPTRRMSHLRGSYADDYDQRWNADLLQRLG